MAFSDVEKVQIRRWMGGDLLYLAHDNRLESAITFVEQISDTDATITHARAMLADCAAISQALADLRNKQLALDVDEVKIDAPRAMVALRSQGRQASTQLAHIFGFSAPLRDPWSGGSASLNQTLANVDHHNY